MGSRSRKRGRTTQAGPGPRAEPPRDAAGAEAPAAGSEVLTSETAPPAPSGRSAKTEAKNQALRDGLEPLSKGERPPWVTYAAIFAAALGLLNIGLYAAGVKAAGADFTGTVLVGAVLLACAAGMWLAKYGAVLAFECLLGITVTFATLSLVFANSLSGAIRATLVILVCSTFFWKLIRAMARLQMPERPAPRGA